MEYKKIHPVRTFTVNGIKMTHCADIMLDADELITLRTKDAREYDIVAKEWGFYATPSINVRLKNQGFRTALVENSEGKLFIMLSEVDKLDAFREYLKTENQKIIAWLDEERKVQK